MAPASFIFRLAALVWVVIFTCDNVAVSSGTFVTASALSPIQLEKEALLNTGWWSSNWTTANYSSDHRKWIGVTCNSAGSIIKLYLLRYYFDFYAQAQLPNGKVFALKKLHTSETEELAFIESFPNEAQVLHRNIVKFCGFCSHRKCIFLIYEYMERGSLFCILHNDDEAVELDWPKRPWHMLWLTCIMTAHHQLFTATYRATTFHLTQNWRHLLLTLALEAFMGNHPRDLLSSLSSSSDPKIMLVDVLDQRLPPPVDQKVIQDTLLVSTVSFACLQSNPKSRPTMQSVPQEFLITPKTPLVKHAAIQDISISQLTNY